MKKDLPGDIDWDENQILLGEDKLIKFALERWSTKCCIDNGVIIWKSVDSEIKTYSIQNDGCIKIDESAARIEEGDFDEEDD